MRINGTKKNLRLLQNFRSICLICFGRGHRKISSLSSHVLLPRHSYKILTKCLSYCVCQAVIRACLSLLFLWANGKRCLIRLLGRRGFFRCQAKNKKSKTKQNKKGLDCPHLHECIHFTINIQFALTWNNEWVTIWSAKHTTAELCNYPLRWDKSNIHISEQRTFTWKYD